MLGRNPGHLPSQGEILADLFTGAGYSVLAVSRSPNRWRRFLEIVSTLTRRRREIDVVVLQVYARRSFVVEDVASRLAKVFGLPVVMVLHGGGLPSFMVRFPQWTRRTFQRADALVAPSEFLARTATAHNFQAQVIPNVLDLSILPFRQRRSIRPRLLWMRSFYSYYNPMMAVRVLARLQLGRPEATLVMAGRDKGLQVDTERLAKTLGVASTVRFPGFLDHGGKIRELTAADIFLNTNHIDNMPVTVLEACAVGLPVIATDVGGIRDLLTDGETALLVPDGDVDAMTAAVERVLCDPALAEHLSVNGRRLAEQCDWKQVRPQWDGLFDRVLTSHRIPKSNPCRPSAAASRTQ